jgi:hypothetical protein
MPGSADCEFRDHICESSDYLGRRDWHANFPVHCYDPSHPLQCDRSNARLIPLLDSTELESRSNRTEYRFQMGDVSHT